MTNMGMTEKEILDKVTEACERNERLERKYFASGGNLCPFCNSENIDGHGFEADSLEAWRTVTCGDCHRDWTELFDMVGIET